MNTTKLTILQINDTHGYLESHPELFWQGDQAEYRSSGGYARLLTIIAVIEGQGWLGRFPPAPCSSPTGTAARAPAEQ